MWGRGIDAIDRELAHLAEVYTDIRRRGVEASTYAIDALLDERLMVSGFSEGAPTEEIAAVSFTTRPLASPPSAPRTPRRPPATHHSSRQESGCGSRRAAPPRCRTLRGSPTTPAWSTRARTCRSRKVFRRWRPHRPQLSRWTIATPDRSAAPRPPPPCAR